MSVWSSGTWEAGIFFNMHVVAQQYFLSSRVRAALVSWNRPTLSRALVNYNSKIRKRSSVNRGGASLEFLSSLIVPKYYSRIITVIGLAKWFGVFQSFGSVLASISN